MGISKVSKPEARRKKTRVSTAVALSSDQPSSASSPTINTNERSARNWRSGIFTNNATTARSKTGVLGDPLSGPSGQAVPDEPGASGSNASVQVANVGAPTPTRLPQGQTATSATATFTTPILQDTVQTGRNITQPAQIHVAAPPPHAAVNYFQAHVVAHPPNAAINQLQAHLAVPRQNAAINNAQTNVAAPPHNAAAINHPQIRVVAPPPTAATNNFQINTAAPPPNAPNIHPQIHVTAPPPNGATRIIYAHVAAPPPNAAMPRTYPHHPIVAQPPHAPTNPFHPPVDALAYQPRYIVTNAILPNSNRPYPLIATRVVVYASDSADYFRTSDNRIYTSYGHVDPVIWSQLQSFGAPNGLDTLLSNDGTLYVRGPDPTPPTAPGPRRRSSTPDAVAGSNCPD